MSVRVEVRCDKCGTKVAKASHTKIKWSREPEKRDPMDLCPSCRDELLEFFGILPPHLPGMKPTELAGNAARN